MKKINEEESNGDVVIILMNTIQLWWSGGGGGCNSSCPHTFLPGDVYSDDIYVSPLLGYLLRDPKILKSASTNLKSAWNFAFFDTHTDNFQKKI